MLTCKCANNLVPSVFHQPTPRGAREERPWFRLVRCLGDKFILVRWVPVFQNVVAIVICNLLKQSCFSPDHLGKPLFRLSSGAWAFTLSTIIPSTIEAGSRKCQKIQEWRIRTNNSLRHAMLIQLVQSHYEKKKKEEHYSYLPWVPIKLAG